MTSIAIPRNEIKWQVQSGIITWTPVLIMLVSRTVLMFSMQVLVAFIFLLQGNPAPWEASIKWYTVYGTGNDIICLILLYFFLKKEGLQIRDLLRAPQSKLWKDVLWGVGLFIVIFPIAIFGLGKYASLLAYGVEQPVVGIGTLVARQLPLWAVIYSVVFWWLINSPTEQMVYNAYVSPRLDALTKRPWLSSILLIFFWSFHHSVFPFLPDWRYVIWRFLIFLPIIISLALLYRRFGRLRPIIICHWIMDFGAVLFTLQF